MAYVVQHYFFSLVSSSTDRFEGTTHPVEDSSAS